MSRQRHYVFGPSICIYIHIVARSIHARTWCCETVGGCKVRFPTSWQLLYRSSQMNAEAASDVGPKYKLNPCTIVSIQVHVGGVWVGVVWACSLIFVWLRGKIWVGDWCCEVVGSCEVQLSCDVWCSASLHLINNVCVCVCVCDHIPKICELDILKLICRNFTIFTT